MENFDTAPSSKSDRADFEAALNVRLAQLLREEGIDVARTEQQQPGSARKRFDIEARIGSVIIAVEAEVDNQRGALADARKRLREHDLGEAVAHEAVAVSYPGGLQVEAFDGATVLKWAVLPSEKFASGRPLDLARAVRLMPEQRGDPEAVARSLDDALRQACEEITANQMLELAEELDLPVSQTVKGKKKDTTKAAAKRGLLAVTAAAMFHSRLDDHLRTLRPEIDARTGLPNEGKWPPDKLALCTQQNDPVGALHDAWQMILAVDYRPIFEAACRALMAPSRDEGWTSAVRRVAQAALSAAAAPSSRSHDHRWSSPSHSLHNRHLGPFGSNASPLLTGICFLVQMICALMEILCGALGYPVRRLGRSNLSGWPITWRSLQRLRQQSLGFHSRPCAEPPCRQGSDLLRSPHPW